MLRIGTQIILYIYHRAPVAYLALQLPRDRRGRSPHRQRCAAASGVGSPRAENFETDAPAPAGPHSVPVVARNHDRG